MYSHKKKHTFFLAAGVLLSFFVFSFLPLSAAAQAVSEDSGSLFEACEAIIDKSLDNVLEDLVRIKAENRELKSELEKYRSLLAEASPEETKQLRTEIQKLQGKIEGYKSSLADSLKKIASETERNKELRGALGELQKNITALKVEYTTLLEENARQQSLQFTQKQTIDTLERTNRELSKTVAEKNREIDASRQGDLKEKLKTHENLSDQYRAQIEQQKKQLETSRDTIAGLKEEISALKDQYRQAMQAKQSQGADADQNQQIISGLKAELARMKERLSEKETLLAQSRQEFQQTKEELESLRRDTLKHQSLIEEKNTALKTSQGDLKDTSLALRQAEDKVNVLQNREKDLTRRITELADENKSLLKENATASSGQSRQDQEIASLKKQIVQTQKVLEEKERIISEHTAASSRERSRMKELEAQNLKLQDQLQQVKTELAQNTAQTRDRENLIKQKDSQADEIRQSFQQKLSEKENELISLKANTQQLQQRLESLQNNQARSENNQIQSLQAALRDKDDRLGRLQNELNQALKHTERSLAQSEETQAAVKDLKDRNAELQGRIAAIEGSCGEEKAQYAQTMQNFQNKVRDMNRTLTEKENIILALQDKVDQYTQIVPEGQLRTQEKYFEKTKELQKNAAQYKRRYEDSQEELRALLKTQNQSRDKVDDLNKTIQALRQENLDLLKEAESLNKTIYSLGLGGELERTKELLTQRQQRQEKYYTQELKSYAQQIEALRQVVRDYEVTAAEVITLLDSVELSDARQEKQAAQLRNKLHTLQSTTW